MGTKANEKKSKIIRLLDPTPSLRSYDIASGPQPLASAPSPHALLVIMASLEN